MKAICSICISLILAISLIPSYVLAQSLRKQVKNQSPSRISLGTSLTYTQAAVEYVGQESPHHLLGSISIKYKPQSRLILMSELSGFLNLNPPDVAAVDSRYSDLSSWSANVLMPLNFWAAGQFVPRLGFSVPLSEQQRENESLYTSIVAGASVEHPLYFSQLVIDLTSVLVHNFHKYFTRADGEENHQNLFLNALSVRYGLGERWSIGASFEHINAFTYEGQANEFFGTKQSISYSPNRNLRFEVGLTNEGYTLEANGWSSNIRFFDENSSGIYSTMALTF